MTAYVPPPHTRLEDLVEIPAHGGRWHFPYSGGEDGGEYSSIANHEWQMAPTDAPASRTDHFYGRPRTIYYDPARTEVTPGEFRHEYTNKGNRVTDLNPPAGMLWRGMSDEEYQAAVQSGYFESPGEYNVGGDAQVGKTYFTTGPDHAESYANSFAPWQFTPTFTRPGHIIGIPDRPDIPREGGHEVGISGRIPFDEVVHHYVGHPYAIVPGSYRGVSNKYDGEWDREPPYRSQSANAYLEWEDASPARTIQAAYARQRWAEGGRYFFAYDTDYNGQTTHLTGEDMDSLQWDWDRGRWVPRPHGDDRLVPDREDKPFDYDKRWPGWTRERQAMAWDEWAPKIKGGCQTCTDGWEGRYTIPQAGAFLNYAHATHQGQPAVKVIGIYTHPSDRGDGVAEALMRRLADDHPGAAIIPGMMTTDGQHFHDRMLDKEPTARDRVTARAKTALNQQLVDSLYAQKRFQMQRDYEQRSHTASTDGIRYARVVEDDVAEDLHRVAMPAAYDSWTPSRHTQLAAVNQDLVDRLKGEFYAWRKQQPKGSIFGGGIIGGLNEWPNIEKFLKDQYPAAHRGLDMGYEEARTLLDYGRMYPQGHPLADSVQGYETGPEAIAQHGYDPKEIAAGMLLLHNKTDRFRGDLSQEDQVRLNDIAQKRYQMQRDYERRQQTAAFDQTLFDRLHREFHDWWDAADEVVRRVRPHTAHRIAMPTWYHLTNDPDFKLDPSKHPNRPYGLGEWERPGVFLTQRPGEWAYSEDDDSWSGDRPYIADIDAPDSLHELPGVWYDPDGDRPTDKLPGSEETFVPADQFHHLTVQRVRPRTASTAEVSADNLKRVIDSYRSTPEAQRRRNVHVAAGWCEESMEDFIRHAKRHGVEVSRHEFNYPLRSAFPAPYRSLDWQPRGDDDDQQDQWDGFHYAPVVNVEGTPHVVDWTMSQLKPDAQFPHVEPLDSYGARFGYHVPYEPPYPYYDDDHHTAARTAMPTYYDTHQATGQELSKNPRQTFAAHTANSLLVGPEDAYDEWDWFKRHYENPPSSIDVTTKDWYHVSPHRMPVGTVLAPMRGDTPWNDSPYDHGLENRANWVWVEFDKDKARRWMHYVLQHQPECYIYRVEPELGPFAWNGTADEGWVTTRAKVTEYLDRLSRDVSFQEMP